MKLSNRGRPPGIALFYFQTDVLSAGKRVNAKRHRSSRYGAGSIKNDFKARVQCGGQFYTSKSRQSIFLARNISLGVFLFASSAMAAGGACLAEVFSPPTHPPWQE